MKLRKFFSIILLVTFSHLSSALIITDLFGDKDGFGAGVQDGDSLNIFSTVVNGPDDGFTDSGLFGNRSWVHEYDLSAFDSISSASIEIFVAGLGALGGSGSLYVDGQFIGLLTDGDSCGSGAGCNNTAHIDTFDLTPYLSLLDGANSMSVGYTYGGDFWALDYSELQIEGVAASVDEPGTLFMMLLGLVGIIFRSKLSAP